MRMIGQLLFSVSLSGCTQTMLMQQLEAPPLPYSLPSKPLSCLTRPPLPAATPARQQGVNLATKALAEARDGVASQVWDYGNLENPREVTHILKLFYLGKRGQQLKYIQVSGKAPATIHLDLLSRGFQHKRLAQVVGKTEAGSLVFVQQNGVTTSDPKARELVPIDVYTHTDGSLVTIRPEGTPAGSLNVLRPQPHASLAVLANLDRACDEDNRCDFDTSDANEAFKVSTFGLAVPKSPAPGMGMRALPVSQEKEGEGIAFDPNDMAAGWTDTIMAAAHIDLPANYAHCR